MHMLDRPRRSLAVALAALAGFVDATGYLLADGYFVSFMSGNTTRLGVDVVARPSFAVFPLLLLTGFVLGVIGGALLAHRAGAKRKPAVLALVAGLLLAAALARSVTALPIVMGLLVLAMGALNNCFQRNGEVAVGLTYMTGALVRMGQGIAAWITGRGGSGWNDWMMLWLGLAAGAVLGALVWFRLPEISLGFPAAWAAILALLSSRLSEIEELPV